MRLRGYIGRLLVALLLFTAVGCSIPDPTEGEEGSQTEQPKGKKKAEAKPDKAPTAKAEDKPVGQKEKSGDATPSGGGTRFLMLLGVLGWVVAGVAIYMLHEERNRRKKIEKSKEEVSRKREPKHNQPKQGTPKKPEKEKEAEENTGDDEGETASSVSTTQEVATPPPPPKRLELFLARGVGKTLRVTQPDKRGVYFRATQLEGETEWELHLIKQKFPPQAEVRAILDDIADFNGDYTAATSWRLRKPGRGRLEGGLVMHVTTPMEIDLN